MNEEGKTNPDLFLLLLHEDVKKMLKEVISIPEDEKRFGFNEIEIDFYVGSLGNIGIDKVCIQMCSSFASGIMFLVNKDGSYRNNSLTDEDLNLVLSLTTELKEKSDKEGVESKYYNMYLIDDKLKAIYREKKLKRILEDES